MGFVRYAKTQASNALHACQLTTASDACRLNSRFESFREGRASGVSNCLQLFGVSPGAHSRSAQHERPRLGANHDVGCGGLLQPRLDEDPAANFLVATASTAGQKDGQNTPNSKGPEPIVTPLAPMALAEGLYSCFLFFSCSHTCVHPLDLPFPFLPLPPSPSILLVFRENTDEGEPCSFYL
ncbi:hypothetical protein N7468_009999 [Penicillium chermesinum]|uniref:Uncharacterized protein n=1 Tax=Penicillium chermesinum TaxID=63820 RepID=A0A9W9NBV6_9EURO|nr:uncharacterized protein N7468_009999 [Penicillium chermesinum]KAJ5216991.1 hypothetical protein N7468_009999 [Penicillium chermesinum]